MKLFIKKQVKMWNSHAWNSRLTNHVKHPKVSTSRDLNSHLVTKSSRLSGIWWYGEKMASFWISITVENCDLCLMILGGHPHTESVISTQGRHLIVKDEIMLEMKHIIFKKTLMVYVIFLMLQRENSSRSNRNSLMAINFWKFNYPKLAW